MRASGFSGAKWRRPRRWLYTLGGVCSIVTISRVAAGEMIRVWPNWDQIIYGVFVVNALLLSWAWFKRVHKAVEDGEYD
jgi:hypothetical protein